MVWAFWRATYNFCGKHLNGVVDLFVGSMLGSMESKRTSLLVTTAPLDVGNKLQVHANFNWYTLSNKNPSTWYFVCPAQAVTWRTVTIIIRVVLLSPHLRIRGVSLSSLRVWKRRIGNCQKLKNDMIVTIRSLTLSWVEAESTYKTNTVITVNPIENMWSEVIRTMYVLLCRTVLEISAASLIQPSWHHMEETTCSVTNCLLRKCRTERKYSISVHPWRYSPLLDPDLPQKTPPFFSVFISVIPTICVVSIQTTSFHLVLGFPTGLVSWNFPLRAFSGILSSSTLMTCPFHPRLLIITERKYTQII